MTSLYYLNARYYNPETFTFITQDSYRGEKDDYGTWNMYAYCGGNPINYVDPSGHEMVFSGKYKRIEVKRGTNMLAYIGAEAYLREKKDGSILLIFYNIR